MLLRSIFLTALLLAAPVHAQAGPECERTAVPAAEFAAWADPVDLTSANYASQLPDAQIGPGQAVELVLHPAGAVRYPVGPGKPGGQGGLAELTIETPGTYRVALGSPGWIDLIARGKVLVSSAHGHGAPCTGIRKIVDFVLKPGRYVVAISAAPEMRTRLLVARRP